MHENVACFTLDVGAVVTGVDEKLSHYIRREGKCSGNSPYRNESPTHEGRHWLEICVDACDADADVCVMFTLNSECT